MATIQLQSKDFDAMISEFETLKAKIDHIDHLFAVENYKKSQGTFKGHTTANSLLNDL